MRNLQLVLCLILVLNLTLYSSARGNTIALDVTTLNVKLYIEGFYIGAGQMNSPLYNALLTSDPTECDYINVSLLDPLNLNVVQSVQGLLYTNGYCTVNFDQITFGNSYYISICHRNSIQTMSAIPVMMSQNVIYDFSVAANAAYGGNMKYVEPTIYAFYSGDINHDCIVDQADLDLLITDMNHAAGGYLCTDLNGDAFVDAQDYIIADINLSNFIFCIYPSNIPPCPSCSEEPCENITADAGPAKVICDPGTCTNLIAVTNPQIISYSWYQLPSMNFVSANSTISVCPFSTTCYLLIVSEGVNCSDSDTVCVMVSTTPVAPTPVNSEQCGYGIPTASVNGIGSSFHWYLNSTGGSPIAGETQNFLVSTYISVTTNFYVSEFNGFCESERVLVTATVNQPDPIQAFYSSICSPINLTVINNGSSNTYSYTWTAIPSAGSGISGSANGSSINVSPTISDTYTYFVVGTDISTGCSTFSSVIVAYSTDDGNACTIDECDSNTGIITHTPVNIDDGSLCTIDYCDPLTGQISHNDWFAIDQLDDLNICTIDYCNSVTGSLIHQIIPNCCEPGILMNCDAGNITLNAGIPSNCSEGPYTYNWSGPNGFTATTSYINPLISGGYNVTITAADFSTYSAVIEVNFERNGRAITTSFAPEGSTDNNVKVFDVRSDFKTLPKNEKVEFPVYSHSSWNPQNLSQVFGVAHDKIGNIFVTATTIYGPTAFTPKPAPIYTNGGGVYKLNASSGDITPLCFLPNNEGPSLATDPSCNTSYILIPQAPGLGNICYDYAHKQLLVTNFDNGKIYRVANCSGRVLGSFDPLQPDDNSPGFIPVGERIWGIAAFEDKVYYSVWANDKGRKNGIQNSIRCVSMDSEGAFIPATDQMVIELDFYDCQPGCYSSPVSDIELSEDGTRMLLSEKTMIGDIKTNFQVSGCFAHEGRVLEYVGSEFTWAPSLNNFNVGSIPSCSNGYSSAGGVDYGYGSIGTNGVTDSIPTKCDSTVWAMGEALQYTGSSCPHTGSDIIYGLQELNATGNNTVSTSILIDLDYVYNTAPKTQIGDVDIFKCCLEEICDLTILTDCNAGNILLCAELKCDTCLPPYTYLWSNGSETKCIEVANSATYNVVVTCANGGSFTASIQTNPDRNGKAVATYFAPPFSSDNNVKLIDVGNDFNSQPKNVNTTPTMFSDPSWNTQNLSEVFGIAHDNAGNIFVTATTIYGHTTFNGVNPGGGVYRLDASTNSSTLLSSLPNKQGPAQIQNSNCKRGSYISNQAPGLGNICYDKFHGQLLVTNFEDGKIYRINPISGNVLSTFDPMVPDSGSNGFAPLGERIWGIGVFGTDASTVKVYYAVWSNDRGSAGNSGAGPNTIRSVELTPSGDFIYASDQLIITIPLLPASVYSNPVSDIEFTENGIRMLLSEKTMSSDLKVDFSQDECFAHQSRVLEYIRPNTMSNSWSPSPNTFQISGVPSCNVGISSTGGADYGFNNFINYLPVECDRTIWAMSDAIHYPSYSCGTANDYIYGLQQLPANGNSNLLNSVLVDLDGITITTTKTQIGDVDIFKCCSDVVICDTVCELFETGLQGWNYTPQNQNVNVSIVTPGQGGLNDHYFRIESSETDSIKLIAGPSFLGKWCCGELCFDFAIAPDPVAGSIYWQPMLEIKNGSLSFIYISNTIVNDASGWVHICAPISGCGYKETSSLGTWTPGNATQPEDWDLVLENITEVNFISPPGPIITGFDNICFTPGVKHISIEPTACKDSLCVKIDGCCDEYTFLWSTGSTDECIASVTEGAIYSITAMDLQSNTYTASVTAPQRLHLICNGSNTSYCFAALPRGSIDVYASGGTGNKTITVRKDGINGPVVGLVYQEYDFAAVINKLVPGHYCAYAIDENGCVDSCCCDITTNFDCGPMLNLYVFVQGFYTGGGQMDNFGSGGLLFMSGISPDPLISDTIFISAMNLSSPNAEVDRQFGILQTDGTVTVNFNPTVLVDNFYYIKINHRNSIETWSKLPVQLNATTNYSFTSSPAQAFGDNQVATFDNYGFAMYSGDINQDGAIDGSDFLGLDLSIQNGAGGYEVGDINGDGSVDGNDFLLLDPNVQNGIGAYIP